MRNYLIFVFCLGMGVFMLPTLSHAELEIIDGDALTYEAVGHQIEEAEAHGDPHIVVGHSEEAQEKAGLPQLDPTWFASQVFWLFVTFGFMLLVFSKRILPNLSETIENRKEHIENDLDTAEKLRMETETARSNYENLMKKAYAETASIHKDNEADLKDKTDKLLANFRADSNTQVAQTEEWIVKAKEDTMADMHQVAADIAQSVADKVSGVSSNITEIKKMVENLDTSKKAA